MKRNDKILHFRGLN
ncbi:hypothetical protein [Escherichia coli]|nr:hypothetical protein [Escherichia coli]